MSGMNTTLLLRARGLFQDLRSSLWFLPTVSVVVAIVAAGLATQVRVQPQSALGGMLFGGGVDGARGMLEAIAASVITVTGLVFSLTVVILQLASSQFSPRLLLTFLRDWGNQVVLSVFLATFSYSLAVLRTIRAGDDPFVPQFAVTGAFLLAIASVAALVYFIHHVTQEIRVDTMMRDVAKETRRIIDQVHPEPDDERTTATMPRVPHGALPLRARGYGFIQDVAVDSLFGIAINNDVVLRLDAPVGGQIAESAPMAWVWRVDGTPVSRDIAERIHSDVENAVQIGHERTPQRDVGFGLRQLVDIAAKALSPAVNDPTTAVHAIGHLGSLLCVLSGRHIEPLVRTDDSGAVRLAIPGFDFEDYLELGCGQIRRYGAREPAATRALLWMLREIALCAASPEVRAHVAEQAAMIVAAAERETPEPYDVERVRRVADVVTEALGTEDLRP